VGPALAEAAELVGVEDLLARWDHGLYQLAGLHADAVLCGSIASLPLAPAQQDLPDAFRAQPKLTPDVGQRLTLLAQLADLPGAISPNRRWRRCYKLKPRSSNASGRRITIVT
jgi:hypothetical protein